MPQKKKYPFDLTGNDPAPVLRFMQEWENESEEIGVTTSGSTGTPKKMAIPKASMIESAVQTVSFFGIRSTDHLLLCLPVDFIAGKMMIVRAVVSGASLVYLEPAVNPLLSLNSAVKIDFAAFTPQQVAAILNDAHTRGIFRQIKTVIIGGGEIPYPLEKKLATLPNAIYATYGMTETITHIAVRKIGHPDRI
jgi:O-succinylbenzoic acid--CoA ligase